MYKKLVFSFLVFSLFTKAVWSQTTKVACIGNSVTYGYLIPDREHKAYPFVLNQLLGKSFEVGNFGHSGATLLRQGHRPYVNLKEWRDAKAFRPDIAVMHLGLNDTDPRDWPNFRDHFVDDYVRMIDTLRQINPKVRVIICRMTPIFSGHYRFVSGTRDWYDQEQQTIEYIAKVANVELLDLEEPLRHFPSYYVPDDVHPNAKGAAVIAKTVFSKISGNYGGLQLPKVFGSHMVLQRDTEIPFWGKADIGEEVTIYFDQEKRSTLVDADGNWKIVFPAKTIGKPHQIKVTTKRKKIVLADVLMGDVWFCSGQSNMDFPLKKDAEASKELDHWNPDSLKNVRWMHMNQIAYTDQVAWDSVTLEKVNDLAFFEGQWVVPQKDNAAQLSAIAYQFGKKLSNTIHVPIGIIQASVGGSPILSWVSRYTLEHTDKLVPVMKDWKNTDFLQPWVRERAQQNIANSKDPLQRHPYQPAYNYEACVSQLVHTPIKGLLWYQGESDAHNIELYAENLQLLVNSWRAAWKIDFPFYSVQLSSINRPSWPYFRDMQRKVSTKINNSGFVVSADYGDSTDVHPNHKLPIANRLVALALLKTYGQGAPNQLSPYQPKLVSAQRGKIVIAIDHTETLHTQAGKPALGFELFTDKGQKMRPEKIDFDGNKVVLTYPSEVKVQSVVYAWQPFTRANITNEAGYPLSTFRLDITQL